MHLFLTGPRGAGKTTALRRALEGLAIAPAGFTTAVRACGPERRLYLTAPYAENPGPESVVARLTAEGPLIDARRFDALGEALLSGAAFHAARLIVMDELGWMEQAAQGFRAAVWRALDGDTPVLGVLREKPNPWTDAVRAHPKVRVLRVTAENRNALPELLAARYPF